WPRAAEVDLLRLASVGGGGGRAGARRARGRAGARRAQGRAGARRSDPGAPLYYVLSSPSLDDDDGEVGLAGGGGGGAERQRAAFLPGEHDVDAGRDVAQHEAAVLVGAHGLAEAEVAQGIGAVELDRPVLERDAVRVRDRAAQ